MFNSHLKIILLSRAIKEKNIISFRFMGHERIVEPYLIGKIKESYEKVLYAWFIDGYTKSGIKNHDQRWRAYPIRKIKDIQISDEEFKGTRTLPFNEEAYFKKIIAKVEITEEVVL